MIPKIKKWVSKNKFIIFGGLIFGICLFVLKKPETISLEYLQPIYLEGVMIP